MGIYLKILAFSVLVLGFAAVAPADKACASAGAGGIAQQTCDTRVWEDMSNRARIETEREIMQNQNLIFKPDSILAYTCFDSLAAHTGAQAGVLFTHTNYWSPQPIQWGDHSPQYVGMDVAVDRVVLAAMRTYYQSNFNHTMLGGRGGVGGIGLPQHEVRATAGSNSQYSCGLMGQVWAVAKCLNFLHTSEFAATDGFYPFINLQGFNGNPNVDGYETINEVRNYPTRCTGTPLPGSSWEAEYRRSRNEAGFGDPNQDYQFGNPLNQAFEQVRDRIGPVGTQGSSGNIQCGNVPPIPTGVTVILSPGTTNQNAFPDGVCTNPGCTYSRNNACVNSIAVGSGTGPGGRPGGPI